jgi:hypothetical protein
MIDLQTLRGRLRRFSHKRRGLLNAALGYRLGLFALLAGTLGLLLLSGWLPGALVNMVLFALLALALLGLAGALALRWTRFRSGLDEAFRLEQLAGNLNSRVVSAWDFLSHNTLTPLTRLVIQRVEDDLRADHEARLDQTERDQRRWLFLGALVVFVGLGLTPLFGFTQVAANFSRSWAELRESFFPVAYTQTPEAGTYVFLVGATVEVGLHLPDRQYETVRLVTTRDNQAQTADLPLDAAGRVVQPLPSDEEAEYQAHFEFGPRRSEDVTLIVTRRPVLVNMQTELVFPPYTRVPPRPLEGIQQRLLALPGTRISLAFTFSKDLEAAAIVWDREKDDKLVLDVSGRFATGSLTQQEEPRLGTLYARDVHGFEMETPLLIQFDVQADEKPVILLPRHLISGDKDLEMLEESVKIFSFGVQALDDYGITRVVLKWERSTVGNRDLIQERGEIERIISPVQPKVVVNYEKVFADMNLKPGDRMTFYIQAFDNRVYRDLKPQVTTSRRVSFFVYQSDLGGLSIKELGLGAGVEPGQERIPKSTRATTVKAPEGLKTKEGVWNQFEAPISTSTRPPTVRGEHGQATQDYFRLLSGVKYPEENRDGRPPERP